MLAEIIFQEWTLDGAFTRFALIALCPLLYCVSLVRLPLPCVFYHEPPPSVLYSSTHPEREHGVRTSYISYLCLTQLATSIGPIAHFYSNSKYYSAIKPRPDKLVDNDLPHITIQMPVFKESLEAVLCASLYACEQSTNSWRQNSFVHVTQEGDADIRTTGWDIDGFRQ
jgi:hypothetical protein